MIILLMVDVAIILAFLKKKKNTSCMSVKMASLHHSASEAPRLGGRHPTASAREVGMKRSRVDVNLFRRFLIIRSNRTPQGLTAYTTVQVLRC